MRDARDVEGRHGFLTLTCTKQNGGHLSKSEDGPIRRYRFLLYGERMAEGKRS